MKDYPQIVYFSGHTHYVMQQQTTVLLQMRPVLILVQKMIWVKKIMQLEDIMVAIITS